MFCDAVDFYGVVDANAHFKNNLNDFLQKNNDYVWKNKLWWDKKNVGNCCTICFLTQTLNQVRKKGFRHKQDVCLVSLTETQIQIDSHFIHFPSNYIIRLSGKVFSQILYLYPPQKM